MVIIIIIKFLLFLFIIILVGKYGCGRTKSAAIVDVLAKEDASEITLALQAAPYYLATDGSTDYNDCKLYPLVVKYYDQTLCHILTVLLSMPECSEASTGENIFKLMDSELTKRNISWQNCMSFGADNANVMQGLNKGLAGYIKTKKQCHLYAWMPMPSNASCS